MVQESFTSVMLAGIIIVLVGMYLAIKSYER